MPDECTDKLYIASRESRRCEAGVGRVWGGCSVCVRDDGPFAAGSGSGFRGEGFRGAGFRGARAGSCFQLFPATAATCTGQ
eukprot:319866-Chlamydomonas_euryale.AAC.1